MVGSSPPGIGKGSEPLSTASHKPFAITPYAC